MDDDGDVAMHCPNCDCAGLDVFETRRVTIDNQTRYEYTCGYCNAQIVMIITRAPTLKLIDSFRKALGHETDDRRD